MQRMCHASMRAALIYQHATSERDREIEAGEWPAGHGSGVTASDLGRRAVERATGIEPA